MTEPPSSGVRVWRFFECRSHDGRLRYATIDLDDAVNFVEKFYYRSKKKDKSPTLCSIKEAVGRQECK